MRKRGEAGAKEFVYKTYAGYCRSVARKALRRRHPAQPSRRSLHPQKVREVIQAIVNEELEAALGADPSTRLERRQVHRHWTRARTLTPSLGALQRQWPGLAIQRRTVHDRRTLEAKTPVRFRPVHVLAVPGLESPPRHERLGTDPRGLPPLRQDTVMPADQPRRAAAPLRSAAQRRREAQSTRRTEGHAEGRSGGRVVTRSDDAFVLFHRMTDTTLTLLAEVGRPSNKRWPFDNIGKSTRSEFTC